MKKEDSQGDEQARRAAKRHTVGAVLLLVLAALGMSMLLMACRREGAYQSTATPGLVETGAVAEPSRPAVPVVPNDSLVKARVRSYCIVEASSLGIQPEQTIYQLGIEIIESQDVEDKVNLTKDRAGQTIQVFSKEPLSPDLFDRTIRARVTLRADERGGKFWISQVEELDLW